METSAYRNVISLSRLPHLCTTVMSYVYQRKTEKKNEKSTSSDSNIFAFQVSNNVNEVHVLFGLVIFRLCNVALVQTWFVPDEYWQAPEIAHRLVFGYGYQTWEWREGIRGYTYPLMLAFLYKCVQNLKLDWPVVVVYLPRAFQAACGAVGEFYVYKFAKLCFGTRTAWWVLFCEVTSWFTFYCITRTLTNSMETALISIGLYYWQLSDCSEVLVGNKNSSLYKALIVAALSCLVRPTALIMWLPLGLTRLINTSRSRLDFVFKFIFPVGILLLTISVLLDCWIYDKFTLVQYNFVYFNIMKNVGELYGTHPWHWYLTQGIPVVLFTHLVPFCIGLYYSGKMYKSWLIVIVVSIGIYSVLTHKEFRFILPIIPMAMSVCGEGLCQVADEWVNYYKKDNNINKKDSQKKIVCTLKGKVLAIFIIMTNVPVALYTGLVHQRGTMDVMAALRSKLHLNENNHDFDILFLMPCHSTPYYSHIHRAIDMKFLDCSPGDEPEYIDEADQFYQDPNKWLSKNYPEGKKAHQFPSHLIFFDVLQKCGRFFYSHFPCGRLGKSVLLYCRQKKDTLHDDDVNQ